jgi:dextranase
MILKVQVLCTPKCVYAASPDINFGRPQILDYSISDSDKGKVAEIRLPALAYWNMVVMEF